MRRTKWVLAGAIAAALMLPGAASAGTVQVTGAGDLLFLAADGEDNMLAIYDQSDEIVVQDYGVAVTPIGGGCIADGDDARCPLAAVESIYVAAGDGENYVDVFVDRPTTIDGTSGSMNVFNKGGSGGTTLEGGSGPDELRGGSGVNTLIGNGGADELRNGSGLDRFHGGPGTDVVSYTSSLMPVTASIDNLPGDGPPGSLDNVYTDVEDLIGGPAADDLRGSSGPNTIVGGWEDDTIHGGGGPDVLNGGDGNDDLRGESGEDDVNGGDGNDSLDGGVDADELLGGAGDDELAGGFGGDSLRGGNDRDLLFGGSGGDVIHGQGGDDTLDGGAGADTIVGGSDTDKVRYSLYTTPVTVDLDGSPSDDGAESEGDTVRADVENVEGGSGNDHITGNAGANFLGGAAGDDTLIGDAGPDQLRGEEGQDTIDAQDGEVDTVDCGGDLGTLTADAGDTLAGCLLPPAPVTDQPGGGDQPPVAPPNGGGPGQQPGGGTPTPVARPALTIGPAAVRLTTKRVVQLKLRCSSSATANCTGTLRLTRKKAVLGKKTYSIAPGKSGMVKILVPVTTARRIGRRGLRVTAEAVTRDAASKRTITLRRARR